MKKIFALLALFAAAVFASGGSDGASAEVTTTNGTTVTAFAYPVPASTAFQTRATVIALSDGDVLGSWRVFAAGKRTGSGNVALVGGILDDASWKDVGATLWGATLGTNADSIRVRVTGAAATSIVWRVKFEFDYYTP